MKFERLEARYLVPEMKHVFSLGDVRGLQRNIGPQRDIIALQGFTSDGTEAWSEIDTTPLPIYSSESTVEAWALLKVLAQNFLGKNFDNPREAVDSLGYLIGHTMFQAAFANMYIDAEAYRNGVPLYELLGGKKNRVEIGVSIPKNATFEQIREKVVKDKFRRIKIKVGPTKQDYEKVAKIRQRFSEILLMIDANSSFDFENREHLQLLLDYGAMGLLMIEQPLAHNDIVNHIALQTLFIKKDIPGRICLDESIHTMNDLRQALNGGIPIINIKVNRVGGLDIAKSMIELCQQQGVDTWIGGTVELTAPGKAHSLAMATHEGVTLPSDISGTAAYFKDEQDPSKTIMDRELGGAFICVPQTIGRGWEVDVDKMDRITKEKIIFEAK
ncbi:MAG: enolase C-terminal domain-like protein [Candidatus Woesebacteria bacterium]|jgi:O-succinylbenzoate synthase